MHHVTESLLVGNLEDAKNPPSFVNGLLFLSAEHDIAAPPGVLFASIPLIEFGEADPQQVYEAVAWLEQHAPKKKIMVCCRAGMGRSVSMVIAYLCCVKGMNYTEALQLLKSRRPGATPLPNLDVTIQSVLEMRQAGPGRRDRTAGGE
jgi:protein-tyrosine phosphatase